tara:strand:- start:1403 stop:2155 length:753 start_codon:yes stop_codon:yes gene_type:complete
MADMIQIRRDTAANWTSANPVLAQGELGIETDTSKVKAGDGSTAWTSLVYLINTGDYLTVSSTNTLTNKTISGASNTLSAISPSSVTGTAATLGDNTFTGAQTFASSLNKFTLTAPTTAATINTRADNLTHSMPDASGNLALEQLQQIGKSASYNLVLADSGRHILHPSADTSARTWTIPANSSVAYEIGTAITFVNQNGAGVLTIAITSDTMRVAGAGTTGSRALAANGIATALKITSTEWIISGTGLT